MKTLDLIIFSLFIYVSTLSVFSIDKGKQFQFDRLADYNSKYQYDALVNHISFEGDTAYYSVPAEYFLYDTNSVMIFFKAFTLAYLKHEITFNETPDCNVFYTCNRILRIYLKNSIIINYSLYIMIINLTKGIGYRFKKYGMSLMNIF